MAVYKINHNFRNEDQGLIVESFDRINFVTTQAVAI